VERRNRPDCIGQSPEDCISHLRIVSRKHRSLEAKYPPMHVSFSKPTNAQCTLQFVVHVRVTKQTNRFTGRTLGFSTQTVWNLQETKYCNRRQNKPNLQYLWWKKSLKYTLNYLPSSTLKIILDSDIFTKWLVFHEFKLVCRTVAMMILNISPEKVQFVIVILACLCP